MPTISDLMTKELIVVDANTSVLDAVDLMRDKQIGAMLIMLEDTNEIIGIFTERDLLTKMDLRNAEKLPTVKICDVMTQELTTIDAEDSSQKALQTMQKQKIRHLPVIKDKKIVGIISLRDLVRV